MNPLLQKLLRVYDPREVGEVVQSPINLEAMTQGRYLLLDGRDLKRADYPELGFKKDPRTGQLAFPAGVFTGTARTLNSSPAVAVIAADGTNFLAAAPNGTAPIQASADGITWSASATWVGTNVASIIVAGTRYVMAGNTAGELATSPMVINTGGTAANLVAKANWTATTVATTTTLAQGLAYGPTANAGAGRTVMIPDAAGTTIWTLDDGATAWVARSHTNSRTKKAVDWTGQQFIVLCSDNYCSTILTSPDGVTWTEKSVPHTLYATQFPHVAASDGAGTVVIVVNGQSGRNTFVVSKDHGVTWRVIPFPSWAGTNVQTGAPGNEYSGVHFVNGVFVVMSIYPLGNPISVDGLSWHSEPLSLRGGSQIVVGDVEAIAYKAGVYCHIVKGATGANTYTENRSMMRLPYAAATPAIANINAQAMHNQYIKARSN